MMDRYWSAVQVLKKSPEATVEHTALFGLRTKRTKTSVMLRIIPLADMNLDYAGRLQDCCHILKLSCTASPDAARVMKAYIDNVRIGGITADA